MVTLKKLCERYELECTPNKSEAKGSRMAYREALNCCERARWWVQYGDMSTAKMWLARAEGAVTGVMWLGVEALCWDEFAAFARLQDGLIKRLRRNIPAY